MVLTDRQRTDLHAGIYEYLRSRPGEAFQKAADALAEGDPEACGKTNGSSASKIPLLEKKWIAIPRLQKKVLELERQAAESVKIHAHRVDAGGGQRRLLPRFPPTHTLKGHSMGVTAIALHPDYTVVVSGSEDGTIKIWDHESGEYMKTLKGHTNTVNSVCFTPKGGHLASCSTDLSIKLWDFTTHACLRTLRGHDHTISCVRFLPSLDLTAAGGSPSSTTTGIEATMAGCKHLISASRDNTVKVWDVETGFCDHTFSNHTNWVRCLAVRQSDGALWASAGNDQVICVYDGLKTLSVELRGHEHVIESLAFVTEEPLKVGTRENKHTETIRDYLASASRDRTVRLWKVSEGSCLAVFKAHENWVQSVLIHPNGNYLISCSDDKTIRVFDIKAERCLRTIEKAHDHFIASIDMHHKFPVLVSASVDQTIKCWQLD
ncbi:platelet-activating factor acetylhydrolase [Fistulifera solaris]|uniref:Lissencephaly-1 homolog n=1 Tax=Fistulifera solaris TaxID=1519565 RepID=A0A1Z5JNU5_FISSO|nr:platelet-activating factor acetylhydrolase [Fistulifera solaris]|eukprot:GAX15713.1 platelet-activating factor acetylhydrolase [Fistulifera solaris]